MPFALVRVRLPTAPAGAGWRFGLGRDAGAAGATAAAEADNSPLPSMPIFGRESVHDSAMRSDLRKWSETPGLDTCQAGNCTRSRASCSLNCTGARYPSGRGYFHSSRQRASGGGRGRRCLNYAVTMPFDFQSEDSWVAQKPNNQGFFHRRALRKSAKAPDCNRARGGIPADKPPSERGVGAGHWCVGSRSLFAQDWARLQLFQQRLGRLRVGGAEAFGQPAVRSPRASRASSRRPVRSRAARADRCA